MSDPNHESYTISTTFPNGLATDQLQQEILANNDLSITLLYIGTDGDQLTIYYNGSEIDGNDETILNSIFAAHVPKRVSPSLLTIKNNLIATVDPTNSNDNTQGYSTGSLWINTTTNIGFICMSATTGLAAWISYTNNNVNRTWLFQEQQPTGTNGGTLQGGTWNLRKINTIVTSNGSDVTLNTSTNQITLQPGTYKISAQANANSVQQHQVRIFDITNNVSVQTGIVITATNIGANSQPAFVSCVYTTSTVAIVELDHYAAVTRLNDGAGLAGGWSVETYSEITLVKM